MKTKRGLGGLMGAQEESVDQARGKSGRACRLREIICAFMLITRGNQIGLKYQVTV